MSSQTLRHRFDEFLTDFGRREILESGSSSTFIEKLIEK
jgi:hypothetical protein